MGRGERAWSTTARGRRAEDLAAAYLARQGYRLVQRNYRVRRGEIDLVAEEQRTLCFIEVRSRASTRFGHPLETIDRRKRQRLLRAAQHFLHRHGDPAVPVRFDVLAIVLRPRLEITLVRGAFTADGS